MTSQTLSAAPSATWADPKRFLWLLSPALPLLAFAALAVGFLTDTYAMAAIAPLLLYVIVPLADWWVGTDASNPPDAAVPSLETDPYYRAIVYAYIPTQYATTILATYMAVNGQANWWEVALLVMAAGVINGIAINTAHELGHKRESLDRWLARLTLAPVAYGHFYVEHNKGHHKNVATPEDPASSRMGESFWAFWPRTVAGSLRSAWSIEKERLARLGKGVWHWENENLQSWAMTVLLFGGLSLWLGPWALVFLLAQAVFGFSLLEVVNYLEHYGLVRQKDASGRYERCQPHHSWNSNHIVTNLVLYQLQRHSDHHANPTRSYQALRHFEQTPQLPSGYASLLMLAYCPPLWFRVMDPLVVKHYQGDLTRANLQPSKREKLLRRYPKPVSSLSAEASASEAAAAAKTTAQAAAVAAASRWQCNNCDYIYDPALGCPHEGFPAGTAFAALPSSWCCPDCAVREKPDFLPVN